jgi:hypothetical protein
MKTHPVEVMLVDADRRMDMKLTGTIYNYANAPEMVKRYSLFLSVLTVPFSLLAGRQASQCGASISIPEHTNVYIQLHRQSTIKQQTKAKQKQGKVLVLTQHHNSSSTNNCCRHHHKKHTSTQKNIA